jgi:beta-xylosidase
VIALTTVLKDGNDYYMTHSSFDASPGLLIWHSATWSTGKRSARHCRSRSARCSP